MFESLFVFLGLLLLVRFNDVGDLILTDWIVHLVFHGKLTLPLSRSSELSCIAEHGSKRNVGVQNEETGLGLRVGNSAAASHKLTHYA